MYKTSSVKGIICLLLAAMLVIPLAACKPPIDDSVVDVSATPETTENTDATLAPTDALETSDVTTEPQTTGEATVAPTDAQASATAAATQQAQKTEAPKTEAPKTETPQTPAPTENTNNNNGSNQKVGNFTGTDLDGNSYSNASFADHKLTIINCWFTGCGPCIQEMPELEKISHDFASRGVALWGLLQDSEQFEAKAREILGSIGVTYPILRNTGNVETAILKRFNVTAYPTTLFVDSQGNVIHIEDKPHNYSDWARLINEHLN